MPRQKAVQADLLQYDVPNWEPLTGFAVHRALPTLVPDESLVPQPRLGDGRGLAGSWAFPPNQ